MVKSFTFFFVEEFTLAMLFTLKYIVYEASDRQGTLVQRRLNTPTSPLSAFRTPSHTKCLLEIQTVPLPIRNQTGFNSSFLSLPPCFPSHTAQHGQLPGLGLPTSTPAPWHHRSIRCHPPEGLCHCLPQLKATSNTCCAGHMEELGQTMLDLPVGSVLPCKGKSQCRHSRVWWLMVFPLLYQVWFKLQISIVDTALLLIV